MVLKIALFGPQGSGKGTQAELLEREYHLPLIMPGNIFRQHIKEATPLGLEVQGILKSGGLVPNEITNQIILGRLSEPDCTAGFVLDGFPRNLAQADALDQYASLTHVFLIEISDAEAQKRIVERRMCACGMTYHLTHRPPKKSGICDKCGQKLFQREDDTESALAKRLKIYHDESEPIMARYAQAGILHRINGAVSIQEVWMQIKNILSA